jgi:hypothetical protein
MRVSTGFFQAHCADATLEPAPSINTFWSGTPEFRRYQQRPSSVKVFENQ